MLHIFPQLRALRGLYDEHGDPLVNNFRPVQTNTNAIYYYNPSVPETPPPTVSPTASPTMAPTAAPV